MNPQIVVSESDARRLRLVLSTAPKGLDPESMVWLQQELDRARIVPDNEIPADVICLHSVVELEDLSDGEVDTFTLVLPADADPSRGKISLLAPLGMGMLGFRQGDEFEWPVPGGTARFRVRRILGNEARRANASREAPLPESFN
jgi:regulator of nucleoside diphosphate kinase